MSYRLLCVIVLGLVCSCSKNKPNLDMNTQLVGNYEWSWSQDENYNFQESTVLDINYGINIDQDGYISTHKNGDLQKIYLFDYEKNATVMAYLKLRRNRRDEESFSFSYNTDELVTNNFPFDKGINVFYRIE